MRGHELKMAPVHLPEARRRGMSRAIVAPRSPTLEERMDDRTRREEKSDSRPQLLNKATDTEQRRESPSRLENVSERPQLTLRESRDRWPIG